MVDDYSVDFTPYDGLDVEKIAREELEKHAVRAQTSWVDNLHDGRGADGQHGEHRRGGPTGDPYINTGETASDVTVEWVGPLELKVGGDVVQLAVAEFGRQPGEAPPPFDAIARWAREKGLTPNEDESFDAMVDAIRFAIARRGLKGFAPGRAAARENDADSLAENVNERFTRELENANSE